MPRATTSFIVASIAATQQANHAVSERGTPSDSAASRSPPEGCPPESSRELQAVGPGSPQLGLGRKLDCIACLTVRSERSTLLKESNADEFSGFEWDESKSAATLKARGFDFVYAIRIWSESVVWEQPSAQSPGDEPRILAIGAVDGIVLTVVWTPRSPNRRIISAYRASRKDRQVYGNLLERRG
jgi:uncharacterized protein